MQIIHKDLRKGIVKLKVLDKDDIWYLSTLIDTGDIVRGRTLRKVKLGGESERKAKVVMRSVTLAVEVEKIEFHKYTSDLRVGGRIVEGTEEIPKGSYHTLNVEENTVLAITKPKWLNYQLKRLNEAAENKQMNVLICVFDREEALFAIMKKYGYDVLSELKGRVAKKGVDEKITSSFYKEVIEQLENYNKKFLLTRIILASPSFWKDELMGELENESLRKKLILATCNSADKTGINEVMKRPEVISAMRNDRIVLEVNLVNELMKNIKVDGNAAYGFEDVNKAVEMGAVNILLITDNYIAKTREGGFYERVDKLMRDVDSMDGNLHIISSEHEGGKLLDGLGGIGALLRYKIR